MLRFRPVVLLSAVLLPAVAGCGTIMQGTSQQVSISSVPTGAAVTVDTTPYGVTPVTVSLSRKNHHTIKIQLEGYQPYELTTSRSTSGWVWGNIVFGGLIGLAVDASTGGMYKLTPEQVQATLARSGASRVTQSGDVLMVSLVLEPAPDWERIGNLVPVR
jgi:hypothetical protein